MDCSRGPNLPASWTGGSHVRETGFAFGGCRRASHGTMLCRKSSGRRFRWPAHSPAARLAARTAPAAEFPAASDRQPRFIPMATPTRAGMTSITTHRRSAFSRTAMALRYCPFQTTGAAMFTALTTSIGAAALGVMTVTMGVTAGGGSLVPTGITTMHRSIRIPTVTFRREEEYGWWYWCEAYQEYYPYVTDCPGGWERVLPRYREPTEP